MKKTWKGSILKLCLTRRAFSSVVFKLRAEGDVFFIFYLLNQKYRKRCLKLNLINLTVLENYFFLEGWNLIFVMQSGKWLALSCHFGLFGLFIK